MVPVYAKTMAVLGVAVAACLPAGSAYADETHTNSQDGAGFSLVRFGQIDDPAEDVLEHAQLFGDGCDCG